MANPAIAVAAPAERTVRWPVVVLLAIGIIIAYIERVNLSFALPEISKVFSLSPEQSGRLLAAFFWSYALLQIPGGWLVDRFGVKWPYSLAFLFYGLVSAVTAMVGSFTQFLVLRVLLGAGQALLVPASLRYIRMNFAEKQRGLAIGVYMSGTKFGPGIAGPVAVYLIAAYGWRAMFAILGVGLLVWLIPWLLMVKDSAPGSAAVRPAPGVAKQAELDWGSILRSPVIWGTCLATFCYMYFVYFCMTWMPIYFKESRGLSLKDSGWFTFMSFSGMAVVGMIGGWGADRLISRGWNAVTVRKIFTLAGFSLAFTQTVGAFTDSVPVALFFAIFSLSGLGLTMPNYWALTQTLMPGAAIGRVAGIQNTAANLAGIASPWITGWMIQQTGQYDAPLMAIGFWLIIAMGCYIFLVREKYAR